MRYFLSGRRLGWAGTILFMVAVLTTVTLFAQSKEELVQKSLPYLNEKVRSLDQDIYPVFLEYAARVIKPDWIKTEDDLSSLFEERESLINRIYDSEPLWNFLYKEAGQWQSENRSGNWEKYDRELGFIGIITFSAEGMLSGFAEGPVLEQLIARVASEPYRLYIRLVEAYARSYGSEYTYMHLKPEMDAIDFGERLMTRFPESKYIEPAKQILAKALFPLTDWHVVLSDDPALIDKSDYYSHCSVGELSTRTYPFWTAIGEPKEFLKAYPGSMFHDVVAKIVEEPSEIIFGKSVHVVIVDEFSDEESARKAILSYLINGIDIPHLITLNETSYIVAYRFFADSDKAKKALERIKKIKQGATIREWFPPDY